MKYLRRVVTRRWNGRDLNLRPLNRESNAITITPHSLSQSSLIAAAAADSSLANISSSTGHQMTI